MLVKIKEVRLTLFLLGFKRVTETDMQVIKLEENYSFAIEPLGKRVRLVVFLSGVEKVCRLKTRKKPEKFLLGDENHLFKGSSNWLIFKLMKVKLL